MAGTICRGYQSLTLNHRSFVQKMDLLDQEVQRLHAGVTLAALVSLLRSTAKPHAIVLYLSKDEFPAQVIGGPYAKAYQILQDKGVTVRYVDGNLRSHKKYFMCAMTILIMLMSRRMMIFIIPNFCWKNWKNPHTNILGVV